MCPRGEAGTPSACSAFRIWLSKGSQQWHGLSCIFARHWGRDRAPCSPMQSTPGGWGPAEGAAVTRRGMWDCAPRPSLPPCKSPECQHSPQLLGILVPKCIARPRWGGRLLLGKSLESVWRPLGRPEKGSVQQAESSIIPIAVNSFSKDLNWCLKSRGRFYIWPMQL